MAKWHKSCHVTSMILWSHGEPVVPCSNIANVTVTDHDRGEFCHDCAAVCKRGFPHMVRSEIVINSDSDIGHWQSVYDMSYVLMSESLPFDQNWIWLNFENTAHSEAEQLKQPEKFPKLVADFAE